MQPLFRASRRIAPARSGGDNVGGSAQIHHRVGVRAKPIHGLFPSSHLSRMLCSMTGGEGDERRRWSRYGPAGAVGVVLLAAIGLLADVEGVVALDERVRGARSPAPSISVQAPSSGPPSTAPVSTAAVSSTPRPTPTPGPPSTRTPTSGPKSPPPSKPRLPQPTEQPSRPSALSVTIRMGDRGRIGPSEFRAGATPGARVDVYDDAGQLSSKCYPSWVLTRGTTVVKTARNSRCTSGGVTPFNFDDSLDVPGTYRLAVTVITDAGQKGSSSVTFLVS